MSDSFRYRLADEPWPSPLSKLALPPLLVFIAATIFQPWGYLLIVFNALALNGPNRNREVMLALIPFPIYYGGLVLLTALVRSNLLNLWQASYVFVVAIGLGLMFAAFAYVSQSLTFELRRYLAQTGG